MGNAINAISSTASNLYNGVKSGVSSVYKGVRGVSNFVAGKMDSFDGWLNSFSGIPVLGELADMFQFNPIYQTIRGGVKQIDEIVDELGPIGGAAAGLLDPVFGSSSGAGGQRALHNPGGGARVGTGRGAGDQALSPVSGGVLAPGGVAVSPVGGGVRSDFAGNTTVERSIRADRPFRSQNISSSLR